MLKKWREKNVVALVQTQEIFVIFFLIIRNIFNVISFEILIAAYAIFVFF